MRADCNTECNYITVQLNEFNIHACAHIHVHPMHILVYILHVHVHDLGLYA